MTGPGRGGLQLSCFATAVGEYSRTGRAAGERTSGDSPPRLPSDEYGGRTTSRNRLSTGGNGDALIFSKVARRRSDPLALTPAAVTRGRNIWLGGIRRNGSPSRSAAASEL